MAVWAILSRRDLSEYSAHRQKYRFVNPETLATKETSVTILAFAHVDGHHIIAWLVIGLIAGVLASLVVRAPGSVSSTTSSWGWLAP